MFCSRRPMLASTAPPRGTAPPGDQPPAARRLCRGSGLATTLPDDRADSVTVKLRGRWTFFSTAALAARASARRNRTRPAEARLRQARDDVTCAVIEAWRVDSANARADAARDGDAAAREALRGTRLEVARACPARRALSNAKRPPRPRGSPKRRHRCRPRRGASACSAVSNRPLLHWPNGCLHYISFIRLF